MIDVKQLETIKNWLEFADALVINAGAGMGVDSGLADYRGDGGQWGQVEHDTAKSIFEVVNPEAFTKDPAFSWNLFAKRIKEYASKEPHEGFYFLKKWISKFNLDHFILTSNIDSHFQKAGFLEENIREVHGSLAYFQSSNPELSQKIWKNELKGEEIEKNVLNGIYPICTESQVLARPNVYMFRDGTYIKTRSEKQKNNFEQFLERNKGKNILVFEIGSGPHVQTIRMKTRMLKTKYGAKIIRINPKNYSIKTPNIGIAKGALESLKCIDNFL